MSDTEMPPPDGQNSPTPVPANDGPAPLPASAAPVPVRLAKRNPVFAELVRGEDDLPGLVGYALYKQNKRDWLASFFKIHGRDPSDAEVESYTVGERTQRRLDTYRKLASDMLDKGSLAIERAGGPTPPRPPSESARVVPARIPALKETAARGAPVGQSRAEKRSRGATATLLFWIIVLIALGVFGYWYVNWSNFR